MTQLETIVWGAHKKAVPQCSAEELYAALLSLVKARAAALPKIEGHRRLYYLSAEFLLGKLLGNNLINLGLYDEISWELAAAGLSLAAIEAVEPEPSLGNGGLGRLAACFLDSIATLGLPGDGIGLCYRLGLFRQVFAGRKQCEAPNPWLEAQGWIADTGITFRVPFKGFTLTAKQMDLDVIGFQSGVNKLRLYDLAAVDESIVQEGISFDKSDIPHNLTLFLYPDDSDEAGRLLRIYQQYFLVSCAAQRILLDMDTAGYPVRALHRHAVVQINDTHPAMVIPELIRLLEARGVGFDEAADIVSRTCAYTNHTILAEALEKWPLHYIEEAVPQLVPILHKLDARAKAKSPDPATHILDDSGRVHMAHLCIHCGFSVNGVAALHTDILMRTELKPFYSLYPERFSNKTNGVTFRRWLMHCNPALAAFITERIGSGWQRDAGKLEGLLALAGDGAALARMLEIKQENKVRLREYLAGTQGLVLHGDAVYDIQIKRFHEYKRQQMNALYVIHQYQQIKAGRLPRRPISLIFGGKAAPAYHMAKDIIHLILCLEQLIRSDPEVSPWLQVFMVENYNVTLAEMLIPACDLSEQISLASKEASGTGNMKFMLNGAVTLGTADGANVEIHQLVGDENIFLFGATSAQVIGLYRTGAYAPGQIYREDSRVQSMVDFITGPELRAIGDTESLLRVHKELIGKDWFMALLDVAAYLEAKDRALLAYEDRQAWARKMLVNTAMAGYFSSDRSIREYNEGIWRLERAQP